MPNQDKATTQETTVAINLLLPQSKSADFFYFFSLFWKVIHICTLCVLIPVLDPGLGVVGHNTKVTHGA